MKKILIVVNTPEFFISHRLPIAIAAVKNGYQVHVATGPGLAVDIVKQGGFVHHLIPFTRSGQNPIMEFYSLIKLYFLLIKIKPLLVHLVTIKPVLYGGIAARLAGISAVVAAISGLGTAFKGRTGLEGVRRNLVVFMYRFAFKQKRLVVIFQNLDDRDTLLSAGAVTLDSARIIRGSGVDLTEYSFTSEPAGLPVVVMASRLLRDKGVTEFVAAARLLRSRGISVDIRLIGTPDFGNPGTILQDELDEWAGEDIITLLGFRSDIAKQYAEAHIVCLPSYYGEGLPKTLIEAAACGRPVVTTDHPGCRDAIIENVTGLLVPIKDSVALADAISRLIESPRLRVRMGSAGRALAESEFAIEIIVRQHLDIYEELTCND
ncbi:glycosyltransferase family 4 protein [Simiduia litorea]|uniref:glycosyltransferase family 4 protein n=1 Tax=Simiduia litorea TaxID=1435348 RepID=UPI0036F338AA